MKNSVVRLVLTALVLALVVFACKGRENAATGDAGTATIERAKPQPEPTGTEAMTQTVSVEEGRSDAEGGGLTNPDPGVTTTVPDSTTGTSTTAPKPAAPPTSTR